MDEDTKNAILRKRAQQLAETAKKDEQSKQFILVLVFKLAHERYGIESQYVRECVPIQEITSLPNLPNFVYGIINVRRKILSVIDLKVFFDLPNKESKLNNVVILEHGQMEFSILIDEIEGVSSVSIDSIQPPLPSLTGIRQDFLKGIAPNQLILLDGHKLLNDPKLIVQESV